MTNCVMCGIGLCIELVVTPAAGWEGRKCMEFKHIPDDDDSFSYHMRPYWIMAIFMYSPFPSAVRHDKTHTYQY